MNDKQLQAWVENVSLQSFGWPFTHEAKFNGRLSSTGGRYFTGTHHIEISRKYYDAYGAEETEKIIKHELCHYHLHLQRRGYKHRDPEFRELLAKVGGTRFCKSLPGVTRKTQSYKYKLQCTACSMEYLRKRKVDPRKYLCGRCRGPLRLQTLDSLEKK
ncbi:SprT family protein [Paenibacillus turpanensis]|uniref:SprT family protein n=1 Tax=Paenibacillus turpanensis TaxID=2689078 RepID=UPI001407AE1F|nr:SprT family protein [Paenibacillus turpanensis]